MNPTKAWYASRGVWGGIIAALGGVASLAGVPLAEADLADMAEHAAAIASAVGGLLAVWGRLRARSTITR